MIPLSFVSKDGFIFNSIDIREFWPFLNNLQENNASIGVCLVFVNITFGSPLLVAIQISTSVFSVRKIHWFLLVRLLVTLGREAFSAQVFALPISTFIYLFILLL